MTAAAAILAAVLAASLLLALAGCRRKPEAPPSESLPESASGSSESFSPEPTEVLSEPPSSEMTKPATMAVMMPCSGVTPEAIPKAMASGNATMPTMMPAMRSLTKVARS